jgi:signal peptidase I
MSSQDPKQAWPASDFKRETFQFLKVVGAVVIFIIGLKAFVIESCPVHGPSMLPLLHENERILVFKLPTVLSRLPGMEWLQPIAPNDLAVFKSVDEVNKHYIKRVVAMGPPRTSAQVVNAGATEAHSPDAVNVKFEFGKVYVNNQLLDEQYVVEEERNSPMEHEAWLEAGQYYALGDHRSVSKDSRRFGPVNYDQLIGRAFFRFWPLSKLGFL